MIRLKKNKFIVVEFVKDFTNNTKTSGFSVKRGEYKSRLECKS